MRTKLKDVEVSDVTDNQVMIDAQSRSLEGLLNIQTADVLLSNEQQGEKKTSC